jgi:hypothetical protein
LVSVQNAHKKQLHTSIELSMSCFLPEFRRKTHIQSLSKGENQNHFEQILIKKNRNQLFENPSTSPFEKTLALDSNLRRFAIFNAKQYLSTSG